ncbi:hypothetical protein BD769DRAFT_144905 [Suillus cothurnatus]|nr:hypothetical protein BD769DRAFT_144905 [Suillus cothurnatus]
MCRVFVGQTKLLLLSLAFSNYASFTKKKKHSWEVLLDLAWLYPATRSRSFHPWNDEYNAERVWDASAKGRLLN